MQLSPDDTGGQLFGDNLIDDNSDAGSPSEGTHVGHFTTGIFGAKTFKSELSPDVSPNGAVGCDRKAKSVFDRIQVYIFFCME